MGFLALQVAFFGVGPISVSQEGNELASKVQRLPPHFRPWATHYPLELVSTLCDVGRQPEIAMAAYKDGINRK